MNKSNINRNGSERKLGKAKSFFRLFVFQFVFRNSQYVTMYRVIFYFSKLSICHYVQRHILFFETLNMSRCTGSYFIFRNSQYVTIYRVIFYFLKLSICHDVQGHILFRSINNELDIL